MELILISNSKLKVMLSKDDMTAFSISCDTLDYDNTETRRVFWQILDEAKHKTGFDAASDKVFVQVYPSRSGGCEMYVTKLNSDDRSNGTSYVSMKVKKSLKKALNYELYCFDSVDKMLLVCKHLESLGYTEESSAYIDEKGRYYLLLCDMNVDHGKNSVSMFPFISEYAIKHTGGAVYPYIKEYCKTIISQKAVKELALLSL